MSMDASEIRRTIREQLALSQRLKARIRELESDRDAPLAVVGMALRFPGDVRTPEAYWDFLLGEGDAIREIPEDRTGLRSVHSPGPVTPGRSYAGHGGFLEDVSPFDPAFFGLSQREAEVLDPQQRLLLETSWEAMERAGVPVRRQDRLGAGVFVGIMTSDYGDRLAHRADRTGIDPYYGTGGGHCMAAGRISYVMGLSGPSMSVDTACSSSLVALHQGAQSVRRGECRYALVGGANVFFSPDLMVSLSQSRALAPDGRSKAFLDSADGYGRGEGVGVVVLMRLDEAERENRPVLAVLRGSAVNHDGASSGLTVPNGPAQQQVIRAALADAGVAPEEIGYVEAHGTGTALGDPIEIGALDAVLGTGARGRTEPLAVGTVKSRIGHLESAAGIAGLIKVVLMLRHGRIPASTPQDAGDLNHLIPWNRLKLEVARRSRPWPDAYERRIAGISAFGMSGTNAHAVLESYEPQPQEGPVAPSPGELLTVSARNPDSLRALAEETIAYLAGTAPERLAAVCATLRDGRTAFEHRLAVTGSTAGELAERLARASDAYAAPADQPTVTGVRLRTGTETALLDKSLSELLTAYPGLAADDAGDAPATRLRRLLGRLGLTVEKGEGPRLTPGTEAALSWTGHTFPLLTEDPEAAPRLLREALAALFTAGADLRLDALRVPGTGRPDDLPTYAFRRRRCWIDEPVAGDGGAGALPAPAAGGAELAGGSAATGCCDAGAVTAFLESELSRIMHAGSGLDPAQTFLAVGGDSFAAMQLTMSIEERYRIEVPIDEFEIELTLTELFERLSTYVVRHYASLTEQESGT
ncbi:beta-ketoacyl synthase N-terminal-like domain-containing protein [Streptomyces sp. NPDC002588]|uniref:type I polyketide synthase n=1 Tax=Streptomyces sp. NPDC002588 TaxID=3154419 RepID=UPI003327B3B2